MTAPLAIPAGVDANAFRAAVSAAKETGAAQPVVGPDGRLVMYVDGKGAPAKPPTAAGQKSGGGGGKSSDPPQTSGSNPGTAPGQDQSTAPKPGTYTLNDGSTETVKADGSRIVVRKDGRRLVLGPDGSVLDVGEPQKPGSTRDSGLTSTGKTRTEDKWDQKANAPSPQQQQFNDATGALSVQSANQAQGWVWVNGQRMRVTAVDGKGLPTALTYDDSAIDPKTGKATGKLASVSTVFNALNLTDIPNAAAPFLMAKGATDIFTGVSPTGAYRPATGDHSAAANTVADGHQMMTISNGLEWFANLATSDPGTYAEMVDELRKSGYAPSGTNGNVFTADAAHAAALAMRDLAVVNSRPGGSDMTLDQFLSTASKQAEADKKKKAMDAYQPVNREMQDPATLKAQAKQAAQAAIGRALTPDEESKFEASFVGKENAMYDSIDATGRAQAGAQAVGASAAGATYTRPDASGEADAYLNSDQFGQERTGTLIGSYAQVLQKMVGL